MRSRFSDVNRVVAALLSSILLALPMGCAGTQEHRTLVVLLERPEGEPGKVAVTTPAGTQVLDSPGKATTVSGPGEPPAEPFVMESSEITELFGPALEALPERPAIFILYFRPGSDELTEGSVALVPSILEAVQERGSVDTSVVGHTDTVGAKSFNYELSRKRALAVRDILVSGGVNPTILDVTSHGEENLLVPTGDEVAEPRNRRVEVTVR